MQRTDITKKEAQDLDEHLAEENLIRSGSTGTPYDRGYGFGGYSYDIYRITPGMKEYLENLGVWGQKLIGADMETCFVTYTIDYDKNTIKVMGVA